MFFIDEGKSKENKGSAHCKLRVTQHYFNVF
jgi:hypothetical protein